VVAKAGVALDAEGIARRCKETLAGYKVPKHIEFAEHIERNALGKFVPPAAAQGERHG
jgi:acyl-CoA synthetase (AMP-forming)/AMP-acid ligase II